MKPLMMACDLLDDAHATQVGRSIEVRPGDAPETIIRVSGPDQRSQMLTATMAMEPLAFTGVGHTRAVVATIRWGAGGAQLTAEADFLQGAVVSVPASYLEILARCEGDVAARVSATMGYGPRGCSGPSLFRTISYGSLVVGVGVARAIPAFATSGVVLFEASITTMDVEVQDFEGTPMFGGTGVDVGTEIPLPNGAASIELTATAGGGKAFMRYALAL